MSSPQVERSETIRVVRRTRPSFDRVPGPDGTPAEPQAVADLLIAHLELAGDDLVLPGGDHPVTVEFQQQGAARALTATLAVEAPFDLAGFEAAMESLDRAHRQLVVLVEEVETPGWGVRGYRGAVEPLGHALEGIVGTATWARQRGGLYHELSVPLHAELRSRLGNEKAGRAALLALVRSTGDRLADEIHLAFEGDRLLLSEEAGPFGAHFEAAVEALFRTYLPARCPQPQARLARVVGTLTTQPPPPVENLTPLRLSAGLLLLLMLGSWAVRVDTWSLLVGAIIWAGAVGIAVFSRKDRKHALASIGGVSTAFLSLVVIFGLIFGVIEDTDGELVKLGTAGWASEARLGEMMLVSVGLAVSAGTTDVVLLGWARFFAMVEMLFFFGTVAGVLGAVSRRLLFSSTSTISGNLPVQGALGEDDQPPG